MPQAITRAEAARELLRRRLIRRAKGYPLGAFVAASEGLTEPRHLGPILDAFRRIDEGEEVRILFSVPPQHGKSLTALHGLIRQLLRHPHKRNAYVSYAQTFTENQSRIAARYAAPHGLELARDSVNSWITSQGGGIHWTSRGGSFTGYGVDGLLLVDDLLKDREEANSQVIRDKAFEWLSSVAFTRVHPGASIIIVGTRWHLDDPIGRLAKADGWEVISLPAINEDGEPLWPEERPLEWLEHQRQSMLPADWSALYMCEPVARGDYVFGPSTYYDELPDAPYQEGHGFDAAYTAKTSADATVTISGRAYGNLIYVTNLIHERLEPMHYVPKMKAAGVNRVTWFRSGTERGLEELLKREGIQVVAYNATTDKLSRAYPAATAWNRGEILLPRNANWTPKVESELSQFTGHDDAHDDIVDALAALHRALAKGPTRIEPIGLDNTQPVFYPSDPSRIHYVERR